MFIILHYMKVEKPASAKHCSLLCPFLSNKQNEVLAVNTVPWTCTIRLRNSWKMNNFHGRLVSFLLQSQIYSSGQTRWKNTQNPKIRYAWCFYGTGLWFYFIKLLYVCEVMSLSLSNIPVTGWEGLKMTHQLAYCTEELKVFW